jgi:hypothetical protein
MSLPLVYLAGSIRDGNEPDIQWREDVIAALGTPIHTGAGPGQLARFLNPVGAKTYNPETKEWRIVNRPSGARIIVRQDFWCVNRADIVLFNFRALSQKYPNIGTLVEFGAAANRYPHCLIYSIVDPEYTGHENTAMFHLHPFIEENSAVVFATVPDAIEYLKGYLPVLSGQNPHFGGYVK